jgi:transposase
MARDTTLFKHLLNVKGTVIEDIEFFHETDGTKSAVVQVHATRGYRCRCPHCNRKSPRYDSARNDQVRLWRAGDLNGIRVYLQAESYRICCPKHGVVTAAVPWAFHGSRFTKDFDLTVAWLARSLPRSIVCKFMRIDWKTVGRCVERTKDFLEPDSSARFENLRAIGIDETSYRKGHSYITVIVNHDTNTVVWVSKGHGKAVLSEFFKLLTPEQRAGIKIITGDGARWIDDCIREFVPHCQRCVDHFHVVQWANEAVDNVRKKEWREAAKEVRQISKQLKKKRGRPKADDKTREEFNQAKQTADEIKSALYALGKAPENLTENQRHKVELIARTSKVLFRCYTSKEALRLILKMTDPQQASQELKSWYYRARHSRIDELKNLAAKIRRHEQNILNSITLKMSNARVEAVNNNIKLIIRKAYGFRNVENLKAMVLLCCSNLVIPLPNHAVSGKLAKQQPSGVVA